MCINLSIVVCECRMRSAYKSIKRLLVHVLLSPTYYYHIIVITSREKNLNSLILYKKKKTTFDVHLNIIYT